MPLTTSQLLADQATWFADFPHETVTVPLGGTDYDCLVPRAEKRNDWEVGGLHDMPRATLILNRNVFTTLPEPGSLVAFRAETWRIVSVRHDFAQSPVMLEIENARSRVQPSSFLTSGSPGESMGILSVGEEGAVGPKIIMGEL